MVTKKQSFASEKKQGFGEAQPITKNTPLSWEVLYNSPIASSRTDDIWFFNQNHGWLVNSSGYVCETTDAGNCWHPKFYLCPSSKGKPYLRCMGWGSEQVGWFGTVTGIGDALAHKDPNLYLDTLLWHTTDGGNSWNAVTNLPEGTAAGICGFYAVNENVAYGAGTNDPGLPGPTVVKTTDGGANWELIDMSAHADNLIDIYFFDENHGIVVGGKNDDCCPLNDVPGYPPPRLIKYARLKPVVLKTRDGGKTWTNTTYDIDDFSCGEWGWKINFINGQFGFVSLENFVSAAILTTSDGGESWTRMAVKDASGFTINQDLEGIGFVNENQGWVGGWGVDFGGLMNSYTDNGGKTWVRQDNNPTLQNSGNNRFTDPRIRINRYRFINDPDTGNVAAGYCSGQQVYKLVIGDSGGGKKAAFAGSNAREEPCHGGSGAGNTAVKKQAVADSSKKQNFAAASPLGITQNVQMTDHDFDLKYQKRDDGSVEISYNLPQDSENVFIGLWNQFAFYIKTLVDGKVNGEGRQTVVWDGKDEQGNLQSEGVYICRMSTNGQHGASQNVQFDG